MRVTRAKARLANERASEAIDASAKTPPRPKRAPLGDVTAVAGNKSQDFVVEFAGINLHSIKQSPLAAKVHDDLSEHSKENVQEILEDDNESDSSSAVDEACEALLRPIKGSQHISLSRLLRCCAMRFAARQGQRSRTVA